MLQMPPDQTGDRFFRPRGAPAKTRMIFELPVPLDGQYVRGQQAETIGAFGLAAVRWSSGKSKIRPAQKGPEVYLAKNSRNKLLVL